MSQNAKLRRVSRANIREALLDLEESHTYSADEIDEIIYETAVHLNDLARKHLSGCNSQFCLPCFPVSHPAVCDFDPHRLPLSKTIDTFIQKTLHGPFGGFIPLTNDPANLQRLQRSTSGPEHIKNLFVKPLLKTLKSLDAELYNLTYSGWKRYEEDIGNPIFLLGIHLISIQDNWYILMSEWSD